MKNLFLISFILFWFSPSSYSQNSSLYIGFNYTDELVVYDTTGGDYTPIAVKTLTSDIGAVIGCYGLTMDEGSGLVYILYSSVLEPDEGIRRLGTLDTISGNITDIGFCGSLADIAFVDGTLFGTTGSYYASYALVELNITDASVTDLTDHVSDTYGPAIGYNPYANVILKFDEAGLTEIDPVTYAETTVPLADHIGECHAVTMKNDEEAIVLSYDQLYEFNTTTNTFDLRLTLDEGGHAILFGAPNCNPPVITVVSTDELLGTDGSIDITVSGGVPPYTFDWDNDGTGDFDDTEDLTGLVAGTYTVVVKDSEECPKSTAATINSQVSVNENETLEFSVFPNPVSENITIQCAGNFSYQIITLGGEICLSGSGAETTSASVKSLASGTYILSLTTPSGTQQVQLVKK